MPKDQQNAKKWVNREEKELARYVAAEKKNGILAINQEDLKSYAAGKVHLGHATVSLTYLGAYMAAEGCLAVVKGDDRGMSNIDLGCTYAYCSLIALEEAYEADARPDKQPRTYMGAVVACWLHAYAIGQVAVAERLARIIRTGLERGQSVAGPSHETALGTLVTHWATGTDVASLVARDFPDLGSYQVLLGRELDAAGLSALCDRHIRSTDDEDEDAFALYPGSLIPFEILAAARRNSFDVGGCDHPLLTWAISRFRSAPALPRTAELDAVLRRLQGELSFSDPPGL